MKTAKKMFLSSMVLFLSAFTINNEPAVVTLISSKNISDASELIVDFDGEIMTDTWGKDQLVRVEMEIKVDDVTREVVKHLVTKRRFTIKKQTREDGSVLLSMPNLKLPVYINGRKLTEDISYKLMVPENILVKIVAGAE